MLREVDNRGTLTRTGEYRMAFGTFRHAAVVAAALSSILTSTVLAQDQTVTFTDQIRPIMERSC